MPDHIGLSIEIAFGSSFAVPWRCISNRSCRSWQGFACYASLEVAHGLQVYFADPYFPWQRGSNENANGLLREFSQGDRLRTDDGWSLGNYIALNQPQTTKMFGLENRSRILFRGAVVLSFTILHKWICLYLRCSMFGTVVYQMKVINNHNLMQVYKCMLQFHIK